MFPFNIPSLIKGGNKTAEVLVAPKNIDERHAYHRRDMELYHADQNLDAFPSVIPNFKPAPEPMQLERPKVYEKPDRPLTMVGAARTVSKVSEEDRLAVARDELDKAFQSETEEIQDDQLAA